MVLATPGQAKDKIFADKYLTLAKSISTDKDFSVKKLDKKQIKAILASAQPQDSIPDIFKNIERIITIQDDTGFITDEQVNQLLEPYEELLSLESWKKVNCEIVFRCVATKSKVKDLLINVIWKFDESDDSKKDMGFINASFKKSISVNELMENINPLLDYLNKINLWE